MNVWLLVPGAAQQAGVFLSRCWCLHLRGIYGFWTVSHSACSKSGMISICYGRIYRAQFSDAAIGAR